MWVARLIGMGYALLSGFGEHLAAFGRIAPDGTGTCEVEECLAVVASTCGDHRVNHIRDGSNAWSESCNIQCQLNPVQHFVHNSRVGFRRFSNFAVDCGFVFEPAVLVPLQMTGFGREQPISLLLHFRVAFFKGGLRCSSQGRPILKVNTGAMHLTERVWGVRMRFLGNSAVFFAFDGSDNDATSESGGDLCGR